MLSLLDIQYSEAKLGHDNPMDIVSLLWVTLEFLGVYLRNSALLLGTLYWLDRNSILVFLLQVNSAVAMSHKGRVSGE